MYVTTFSDKRVHKIGRDEDGAYWRFGGKKGEWGMMQLFYNLKIKNIEKVIGNKLKKMS